MSILLPKPSKGIKFDYIFSIDMNDFDVEMLLPALFHLIRTRGAPIGKANDPELFSSYLDRLTQHDRFARILQQEALAGTLVENKRRQNGLQRPRPFERTNIVPLPKNHAELQSWVA
jgi:hypothetical protein